MGQWTMREVKKPLGPAGNQLRHNLRQLRIARGLTYRGLDDQLAAAGRRIDRTALTRIESGERRVDVDDLVALSQVLGVAPEQLYTPIPCDLCHGVPPEGFTCNRCGRAGSETSSQPGRETVA